MLSSAPTKGSPTESEEVAGDGPRKNPPDDRRSSSKQERPRPKPPVPSLCCLIDRERGGLFKCLREPATHATLPTIAAHLRLGGWGCLSPTSPWKAIRNSAPPLTLVALLHLHTTSHASSAAFDTLVTTHTQSHKVTVELPTSTRCVAVYFTQRRMPRQLCCSADLSQASAALE